MIGLSVSISDLPDNSRSEVLPVVAGWVIANGAIIDWPDPGPPPSFEAGYINIFEEEQ